MFRVSRRVQIRHFSRSRWRLTALEYPGNGSPDLTEIQLDVRNSVAKICLDFGDAYWSVKEERKSFPSEFHQALAQAGWLGMCLPNVYGGSDLGLSEAAVMMNTISESGAGMSGASAIHMNIFGLEPVAKFGTDEQKDRHLPPLIQGKERACFAVTEPSVGLDTLKLQSLATRLDKNTYSVSGSKVWISTAQVAEKILLLVRTTPLDQVASPSLGLSLFYTKLDRSAVTVQEIPKMGRAAVDTNTLFFEDWHVPAADRLGEEGDGFKMIMKGMNAERVLIASEACGLGMAAVRKAAAYANERIVFGRTIGQNQAKQHPLAQSWMRLESARLMVNQAARMYDAGAEPLMMGAYANSAKYLAGEAAFEACDRAVMTLGGMGYAKEYVVERLLRESYVPRIAPVSREMICNYIGERILGLKRSY